MQPELGQEHVRMSAPASPVVGRSRAARAEAEFRAFVADPRFPCLAAKGVIRGAGFRLGVYGALGSLRSTSVLGRDLADFVAHSPPEHASLHAYVAVFPRQAPKNEVEFERRLWLALERLHAIDSSDAGWDPTVSADPEDPDFSFSFAGRAMFVVGLHPASSRMARRFRWPALVFNPHAQFERLRADGRFAPLQTAVREREIALQGSLNPNLADFGDRSEARQYSGRAVENEWQCPFHRETK
jgi:FPC/CPF motif-containing protein YcgG